MIRRFQRRDLGELHQLDQVCFSPEVAYSKSDLKYFLANPRCSCWIAQRPQQELAGFIILERARRGGVPSGHIVTIDVNPVERRRGVGSLLMHTAEEQMKQEGITLMSLEVAANNIAAQTFYRGLGFITSGKIANYYGGRIDAEIMEKAI
jgi:ribosomal-protein-alanine N-acetyltransferase